MRKKHYEELKGNQNWPINLGRYMGPSDQRRGGDVEKETGG